MILHIQFQTCFPSNDPIKILPVAGRGESAVEDAVTLLWLAARLSAWWHEFETELGQITYGISAS